MAQKIDAGIVSQSVTIQALETSVIISHGLGRVPLGYGISPLDIYGAGYFITNETETTFTLNVPNSQVLPINFKVGVW